MNDFGILNNLIENFSKDVALNNKLSIALLIFIFINLITTIINIISQHRLKLKDKKIISFKIKEEKRIKLYENIYKQLDKLSFYDGKSNNNLFLESIQNVEKYLSCNKLYFNNKETKLIYEISDYYKTVLSDFRKKDYLIEEKYFKKLSSNFNK
ncbi:MAG: hypothetical protein R3342_03715 [Lutibacter sp.]|uniref:hypothetical protein n=1 Tax=Lutibacter sp. TaxID=1925666 RepID=UPI00299E1494|nr:hypothetical protein [Lutibacter sp.]MDX1828634.1 hypothetical protein [Lutibacter sp.]